MTLHYATKAKIVSVLLPLLIVVPFSLYASRATHQIFAATPPSKDISIAAEKDIYTTGEKVRVIIANHTAGSIYVANNCPYEPFEVYAWSGNNWHSIHGVAPDSKCAGEPRTYAIPAEHSVKVSYDPWPSLFATPGKYRIVLTTAGNNQTAYTDFEVVR